MTSDEDERMNKVARFGGRRYAKPLASVKLRYGARVWGPNTHQGPAPVIHISPKKPDPSRPNPFATRPRRGKEKRVLRNEERSNLDDEDSPEGIGHADQKDRGQPHPHEGGVGGAGTKPARAAAPPRTEAQGSEPRGLSGAPARAATAREGSTRARSRGGAAGPAGAKRCRAAGRTTVSSDSESRGKARTSECPGKA